MVCRGNSGSEWDSRHHSILHGTGIGLPRNGQGWLIEKGSMYVTYASPISRVVSGTVRLAWLVQHVRSLKPPSHLPQQLYSPMDVVSGIAASTSWTALLSSTSGRPVHRLDVPSTGSVSPARNRGGP